MLRSPSPARRSLEIIEFLENEKGTLRSTFWLFWPKKVKRNSISEMKSVWTCRRMIEVLFQGKSLEEMKF